MKIKIILFICLSLLLLNCKQNRNNEISNNTISQKAGKLEINNQSNTSDSISFWSKVKLGSENILKKFPEHWSFPSIISDDYDESSINEFNASLDKIQKSYNLTNKIKEEPFVKIPETDVIIKDTDFELLNYPITIHTNKLYQLYKLNDQFFVAIFLEINNKPINGISSRMDLVVLDLQFKIIDKVNILIEGNGDQHAFMKYFFIDDSIINTRNFYVYDGESSASSIKKYKIKNNGKIISN